MTNPAGNPMDAVAVLMQERQRYEAWLAQLESKRAITPPHVFDRVKGDYERRLKEVTAQLVGRTSEVQATMAALTERLARFQTEETAIRDERYEAELRSHVGELGATEWAKLEKESDDRLAKIGAERASVTGEIARLQQMLAMAGGPTDGTTPGGSAVTRGSGGAQRPARGSPGFDELEFLNSVTGGVKGGTSGAVNGAPSPSATPPDSSSTRSSKGVAAEKPRGTPASATPVSTDSSMTGPTAGTSASSTQPSSTSGSGTPAAGAEESEPKEVPSFLRDVPQEQSKTLRCGDCGSMNFPTEWYCERCGAELAGM